MSTRDTWLDRWWPLLLVLFGSLLVLAIDTFLPLA
jgi:hypothetical protein